MPDDAIVHAEPILNAETGTVRKPRAWVLVRDGIVQKVHHTHDWFKHPFGENHGGRVIDGTGADVQPGYMVDAKGNFTPAEGRTAPIPQGLPAYHAGPGLTRHTADVSAELGGGIPVTKNADGYADLHQGLETVEPRNKDVAEHDDGSEPVHTTDVVDAPNPAPVQPQDDKASDNPSQD